MTQNQIKTATILLFFFGALFYTASVVRLPNQFSLDINGMITDMNIAFISQAIGNVFFFVGLLFGMRIKNE
jgi:hypothetical protein